MLASLSNIMHHRAVFGTMLMTILVLQITAQTCEVTNANLTEILEDHNLPALGASYDDGISGYKQAQIGAHKIGTDIAARSSDMWHLGSNTKAMVAMAIGLMVQDGRLNWNTPLEEVLDSKSTGIVLSKGNANITVRLLSSHTAGLSDSEIFEDTERWLSMYNVSAAAGRLQYGSLSLSSSPSHPQGVYEYANMNYVILGLIIDVVAGVPVETHMQSRLFGPLNMTSAGWGPLPEVFRTSARNPYPHFANGTLGLAGPPIPYPAEQPFYGRDYPPFFHTAGMAHMTLEDYNKWLRLHVNKDVQMSLNVSQQTLAMLHRANPETNKSSEGFGYTYGAWIRSNFSESDGYLLVHDGSNLLNYITAAVDTARNVTVVATTNVGGVPVNGAAWIAGIKLVGNGLLTGDLGIRC